MYPGSDQSSELEKRWLNKDMKYLKADDVGSTSIKGSVQVRHAICFPRDLPVKWICQKKISIFNSSWILIFILFWGSCMLNLNICYQGEHKKIQKKQMEREEEARGKGQGLQGTETEGCAGDTAIKPKHFITKVM